MDSATARLAGFFLIVGVVLIFVALSVFTDDLRIAVAGFGVTLIVAGLTAPLIVTPTVKSAFSEPEEEIQADPPSIATSALQSRRQTIAEQLRDLQSLFDDGIISKDEFDKKKKQVLGL